MAFFIGQKVTPKDDESWVFRNYKRTQGPKTGDVLVIASMHTDEDGTWLQFNEWPRDDYDAEEFVPVVERKTNISEFTAMLKPKKVRARV